MTGKTKYNIRGHICGGAVADDVHVDVNYEEPDRWVLRRLGIEMGKPEPELSEDMQKMMDMAEEAAREYEREPTYFLPNLGKYKDGDIHFGTPTIDEFQRKNENDEYETVVKVEHRRVDCFIHLSNEVIIL